MQKSATRPVFLNLLQIWFPIGSIVSITHRVTGVGLALLTPFAIWTLQVSLESEARFEQVRACLASGLGRALTLLVLWALVQHLYSGVRHLFMDIDMGVELGSARRSGWLTFIASVITVVVIGVLL